MLLYVCPCLVFRERYEQRQVLGDLPRPRRLLRDRDTQHQELCGDPGPRPCPRSVRGSYI